MGGGDGSAFRTEDLCGGHAADLGRGGPVAAKDAPWRARHIARVRPGPKPAAQANDALQPVEVGSLWCCAAESWLVAPSSCGAVRAMDYALCGAHAARPVGRRTAVVPAASIAQAMAPLNSATGLATRTPEDQGIGPCWPNRPTLKVRRDSAVRRATSALIPATQSQGAHGNPRRTCAFQRRLPMRRMVRREPTGADERIRTLDPDVGKDVL